MKGLFVKLISVLLILTLFGSCMTVTPDNRNEAINEMGATRAASISKVPPYLENSIGPGFKISAYSRDKALMIAGQLGVELNYKYFIIIDGSSTTYSSYSQYGSYSYTVTSITVAYTNVETYPVKNNTYYCSTLLDGKKILTKNGEIASWMLWGTSFGVGTAILASSLARNPSSKPGSIFGGILMGGSLLFVIPIYTKVH